MSHQEVNRPQTDQPERKILRAYAKQHPPKWPFSCKTFGPICRHRENPKAYREKLPKEAEPIHFQLGTCAPKARIHFPSRTWEGPPTGNFWQKPKGKPYTRTWTEKEKHENHSSSVCVYPFPTKAVCYPYPKTGKGQNGTEKPLGRRVAQGTRNINQSGRGRRHPLTAGTACEPTRQRSVKAVEKVPQ